MVDIDCTRLREKAALADMFCTELMTVRESTERLVLSLCGEWQGSAEKAYSGKILYIDRQFQKVEEVIKRISKIMSELSDEYEELDYNISSVIKSI